MKIKTNKERIAELEVALAECITYLRALPLNPITYRVATHAESILLSEMLISDGETYGETTMTIKGNNPVTFHACLNGSQQLLKVNMDGVINMNGAQFCAALRFGMEFEMSPDTKKSQLLATGKQWDELHQDGINITIG